MSEEIPATLVEQAVQKYSRNTSTGLYPNVAYVFNEDGSINWREMIKPEFLYVNKEWFENRQKPIPSSIEGLKDKQLLIMLGGIKELAKLRGFSEVSYNISGNTENAIATCTITWIPNYETPYVVKFSDCANASVKNTDDFGQKFLETMACNRAFVRAVRNFLNIHIVGADEIMRSSGSESSQTEEENVILKPWALLEKTAEEKNLNFDQFIQWLRTLWKENKYRNDDCSQWKSFKDIPTKECRILTKMLSELN